MVTRRHTKLLSHQDIQTVRKLKSVFLEKEEFFNTGIGETGSLLSDSFSPESMKGLL